MLGLATFVEVTKGREDSLANSFSVGAGSFSRMPTSPFAKAARCAASICSATRLFGCFVLSRICLPFQVNLYHQFSEPFCL